MTALALILILASATTHASWNLIVKRALSPPIFVWWLVVSASVVFAPVVAVVLIYTQIPPLGWLFAVIATLLHLPYFLFLGRVYTQSDLSTGYPIARGIGSIVVPLIAIPLLGERVSPGAIIGIFVVFLGIFIVYWGGQLKQILREPLKFFRELGIRYALRVGVNIAAISIVDKVAVSYINEFVYEYFTLIGVATILLFYIVRHYGVKLSLREWQKDYFRITVSGILYTLSYLLYLFALSISQVSYAAPARQVSIVIGAVMGNVLLKEPFGRSRILGSSFILLGLVFLSFAP